MRDQSAAAAAGASDAKSSKRWWPLVVLSLLSWGVASWLVFVWLGIRTRTRVWFVVAGVSAVSYALCLWMVSGTGPNSASSSALAIVLAANWVGSFVCVLAVRYRSMHPGAATEQVRSGWGSLGRRGAAAWKSLNGKSPRASTLAAKAPPKLWLAVVVAVVVVAITIWGASVFVRNEIQDVTLAHQGVTLMAVVTGTDHQDDGDGTASDFLWVRIPACDCSVLVPTDNPAAHPARSRISVRYNPQAPTQAEALVDVPDAWFGDVAGFAFAALGLLVAYSMLQHARQGRRRQPREAVTSDPPSRPEASGMVVVGRLLSDSPASGGRTRTRSLRRGGRRNKPSG